MMTATYSPLGECNNKQEQMPHYLLISSFEGKALQLLMMPKKDDLKNKFWSLPELNTGHL